MKNLNNFLNIREFANLYPENTGIKDVVIWIGPNPEYHWKRIKISNSPNKFNKHDNFTLTIPDFKIIGKIDDKFINTKKLDEIKNFIISNQKNIDAYLNDSITTDEFFKILDGELKLEDVIKLNEQFKQQLYTVGDVVKLKNGNVAKIVKINSKYSYIINLMANTMFSKEPIEVKEDEILELVKSNSEPAVGTDMTVNPSTDVTNDLVINGGIPDVRLSNTVIT